MASKDMIYHTVNKCKDTIPAISFLNKVNDWGLSLQDNKPDMAAMWILIDTHSIDNSPCLTSITKCS
jgi:hypothetical protein